MQVTMSVTNCIILLRCN